MLVRLDEGFCAGFHEDNSGCNGDSGSPLVCEVDGRFVVAGVTSWASGDCHASEPTGFANVEAYLEWITEVIVNVT